MKYYLKYALFKCVNETGGPLMQGEGRTLIFNQPGSSASIMTAGAVAGMNLDILKSCKLIPICTEKFFCLHVKGIKNNKTRIVTRREESLKKCHFVGRCEESSIVLKNRCLKL